MPDTLLLDWPSVALFLQAKSQDAGAQLEALKAEVQGRLDDEAAKTAEALQVCWEGGGGASDTLCVVTPGQV
jgi:hypothetical protein